MTDIYDVRFRRMGYSGDEKFAEVEVVSEDFKTPLIATFKQNADGGLELVNVTGVEEDPSLDWFDNNLHNAFPPMQELLFSSSGEDMRWKFAESVLACNNMEEILKDKFYYGE